MDVPAVFMRGGTSKACFIRDGDLPDDPWLRDQFLLAAYGSPDPLARQLDGIGGGVSSTSKVAVLGVDESGKIRYDFGQIDVRRAVVDRSAPCGNIASAVGPYAIDAGLIRGTDPVTVVPIRDVNNGLFFRAHVPTRAGRFDEAGDTMIAGVPRPGSRIDLELVRPGGAPLPTGCPLDVVQLSDGETLLVSVVNAGGLVVFVRDTDFGMDPWRPTPLLNADQVFLDRVEDLRASVAVALGIAPDRTTATRDHAGALGVAIVGSRRGYVADSGEEVTGCSVRSVASSMGMMHRVYPISGAFCLAVAAAVPGTVVASVSSGEPEIRIGSPAGILTVSADVIFQNGVAQVLAVRCVRTARRIMGGELHCPDHYLAPQAGTSAAEKESRLGL